MAEMTFKLTDDLVKQYGELFIRKFFEKQMEYLSQLHSLNKIEAQIDAANLFQAACRIVDEADV